MNSIQLIGRITKDLELKKTQSGLSVCSFSLAVDRPGTKDTTDFINIIAWKNTSENLCRYMSKGSKIGVTGVLTSRSFEDRNGNKRTAYEVSANNIEFLDSKQQESAFGEPFTESDDNDSPF